MSSWDGCSDQTYLLVQFSLFIALEKQFFHLFPFDEVTKSQNLPSLSNKIVVFASNPASWVQFAFLSPTSHQSCASEQTPASQCQECHIVKIIFILIFLKSHADPEGSVVHWSSLGWPLASCPRVVVRFERTSLLFNCIFNLSVLKWFGFEFKYRNSNLFQSSNLASHLKVHISSNFYKLLIWKKCQNWYWRIYLTKYLNKVLFKVHPSLSLS